MKMQKNIAFLFWSNLKIAMGEKKYHKIICIVIDIIDAINLLMNRILLYLKGTTDQYSSRIYLVLLFLCVCLIIFQICCLIGLYDP